MDEQLRVAPWLVCIVAFAGLGACGTPQNRQEVTYVETPTAGSSTTSGTMKGSSPKPIPGIEVVPAGLPSQCMTRGANNLISLAACGGQATQLWIYADGRFSQGGLCIGTLGHSLSTNTPLTASLCDPNDATQTWVNSTFLFSAAKPGPGDPNEGCLSVPNDAVPAAGMPLVLAGCGGNVTQWWVAPTGSPARLASDSNTCLQVGANTTVSSGVVDLTIHSVPCNGTRAQLWTLRGDQLQAMDLGNLCLTCVGTAQDSPLSAATCDTTDVSKSQKWAVWPPSGAWSSYNNGLCVTNAAGNSNLIVDYCQSSAILGWVLGG